MTHPDIEKAAEAYDEAYHACDTFNGTAAHLAGIAAVMKFTLSIEPSEGMNDVGSRTRVSIKERRGTSALTLAEYAAPYIMAADRIGMAESFKAMQTTARKELGLDE